MIPLLQRRLRPSFLILGAEKGGTTAFFHYLAQHPRISAPREKEICFFHKDSLFKRGTDWYHRQFPAVFRRPLCLTFEASPAYLYYPGVAERIVSYSPAMKLIAVLRDPVDRAYSAWNMHRQLREQSWDIVLRRLQTQPEPVRRAMLEYYDLVAANDFPATVRHLVPLMDDDRVEPGLLKRGLYAQQIERFRQHFPAQQLLVLESQRCRENLNAELDRAADFLSIERVDWSALNVDEEQHHRRPYGAPLPEEASRLLRDLYRHPNEEVFALLGERFPWKS